MGGKKKNRTAKSRDNHSAASPPERAKQTLLFLRPHALAIAILCIAAAVVWWRQHPVTVLDMNSDMHNISGVVMSMSDPGRYEADNLLNDPDRFSSRYPLYRWLTAASAWLAGGFPGGAWLMVLPTSVLFLVGGYFLLWRLTGGRLLAVGLVLALGMARIWFQLGEKWSMSEVWGTMPRTQFTALLPWLLLAAWEWRYRYKLWPVVAGFAALLVHIHPPSAPPWGLAIWCAFVLGTGDRVKWRARLKWGAISAIIAGVIAVPYIKMYALPKRARSTVTPEQREYTLALAKERFSPGLMDLRDGFGLVWRDIVGATDAKGRTVGGKQAGMATWGAAWALLGVGVGCGVRARRRALLFFLIGLVAFGLLTIVLPLVDSIRANAADVKPRYYDLARGIRFWPFWLLLLGAVGCGAFGAGDGRASRLGHVAAWVLPLVAVPTMWWAVWGFIDDGAGRYVWGDRKQRAERSAIVTEVIEFIRANTPPDAVFVIGRNDFWLRHTPGRPVCHSWKEGSSLVNNYAKGKAWKARETQDAQLRAQDRQFFQEYRKLAQARKQGKLSENEARLHLENLRARSAANWKSKHAVWRSWGADYALQPAWTKPLQAAPGVTIEFENRGWLVARLTSED